MKLYATTTSERGKPAHKGGNEYVRIELTVGNAKEQASAGIVTLREIAPDVFQVCYTSSVGHTRSKELAIINVRGTVFESKSESKRITRQA